MARWRKSRRCCRMMLQALHNHIHILTRPCSCQYQTMLMSLHMRRHRAWHKSRRIFAGFTPLSVRNLRVLPVPADVKQPTGHQAIHEGLQGGASKSVAERDIAPVGKGRETGQQPTQDRGLSSQSVGLANTPACTEMARPHARAPACPRVRAGARTDVVADSVERKLFVRR